MREEGALIAREKILVDRASSRRRGSPPGMTNAREIGKVRAIVWKFRRAFHERARARGRWSYA